MGADFAVLEYAIERKILEAPILELSYYVDVVGVVPHQGYDAAPNPSDPFDIGNGDLPPEWGFDLVIRKGVLRYGPWADRQRWVHLLVPERRWLTVMIRVELQRTFFPPVYQSSSPTPRLRPGDTRVWPSLKVFVELRDTTTLQIPFREASKVKHTLPHPDAGLLTPTGRTGNGTDKLSTGGRGSVRLPPSSSKPERTRRSTIFCPWSLGLTVMNPSWRSY